MAAACCTSYITVGHVAPADRRTAGRQRPGPPLTALAQPAARNTMCSGSACSVWGALHAVQQPRRRQCVVQAGGKPPVEQEKGEAPPTAASTKWLDRIGARWQQLSPQQQVYAVIAGAVLSAVLWQLLTLGVVLLERLLLGSLIAAEEALLSVLVVAVGLFLVFAAVNAVGVGAYLLGGGNDGNKNGS